MVGRLRRIGLDVAFDDVVREAGDGAVGRPHVARALVERGLSADMNDAFARYLGRGRPGYVEKPLPALRQVTDLVHAVGARSEEHTSELQSLAYLVCRLLLEKKKKKTVELSTTLSRP